MKATIMTSRIHKLLAACAAFAFVVPTTLLAQQPTNLQLHNINAGAVGARWLLQPGTAVVGGPYLLMLPNSSGTLIAGNGSGTPNRLTRWTGPSTLGDASLDDDGLGVLSRAGTIQINPGLGNTLSTNGSVTVNSAGAQDLVITESALTRSGGDFTISLVPSGTLFNTGNLDVTGSLTVDGQATLGDGSDAITLNAGLGTFTLQSSGLNVTNAGDISDNGGAVIVNDAQGLNVQLGGVDIDAGGLNVDAGGATIRGTTAINNVAAANTTTIGNVFAGNNVSVRSATVTMANLPAGAVTDNLVTSNAGALRTASVTTMLGGTPWLLGGNTVAGTSTIGTNNAFDLGLETNGTTHLTLTSAGAITQGASAGQVTFTGNVDATNGLDVTGALTVSTTATITTDLTVNGAATLGNGGDNISLTAGTGTFTLTSTGLNVTSAGDISDNGGAVIVNDAQGLNVQLGGIDIDAGGLNVDAGGATILGTTAINNVASANTTTIGNVFAGNNVSIPSASVTMANLPAGAVTDNLVTIAAGALRATSVATMLGNTAWLVGGNSLGAAGSIGTNDANDLNIETGGTTRFTVTAAGALNQQAGGGNISLTGNVGIEAAPVNNHSLTASKTAVSAGANIGAVGYASGGVGNLGVLGAVGANAADIVALETNLVGSTSNAGVAGYNRLGAGNNFGVAAFADHLDGKALVATALGNNGLGIMVAANIGTGTTGMQIDASGTGIVLNSSTLGLNIQTGGATIVGTTNINNTAAANTTTIGNNTVGNTVSIPSASITMANLPAGAATDNLVTIAAGALRTTSVATMLGNTAWLVGGNTIAQTGVDRLLGMDNVATADHLAFQTDGAVRMRIDGGTGNVNILTSIDVDGTLNADGSTTLNSDVAIGNAVTDAVLIYGAIQGANPLVFDGATDDANELTISVFDPGADRTYTIPDAGANANFVLTEGAQTVNGNKTHLGNVAINNSGAGTTGIGSGTATGAVTIGNSANSTTFGSEIAHTPVNQGAVGGGPATLATFTSSFERVTITEGGADYVVRPDVGTSDGQIVYLRLFFDAVAGTQDVTFQGVGGAPNFFIWDSAGGDATHLLTMIWDNTAGEWQIISNIVQP